MMKHFLVAVLVLLSSNVYAEPAAGYTEGATTSTSEKAKMVPVDEPILVQERLSSPIHQELRALLQGIETAINTEKYGDLKQYFDEKLHVTTINQNVITTPAGIDAYFTEWFGKGGYLKKLEIKLSADGLTELYGATNNPSWGLVYGSGVENYQLADGRFLPMKTRWTATVTKGEDGKWRILALHIGANFYDNPIFHAVKDATKYYAAGGLVVGLLLGALLMAFLRRKKR